VYLQPTTQQARRHAHCATRPTPTEDTSASERRARARTCNDAYPHADDRRSTTDDGRRRPNVHTRMQATHHHTTPTASRRGGALHHGTIDDPRRYERQQAPNTRNDSIDRAYPRREEAPLQPAASMASSRERPPHLTSAASATRHATKIGTPADETSDEGERRVTSVRPIASNTARAKVLRDGMHARRHNKRRESVSTRNPSTITQRENTASAAPPPLLAPIDAQCALGRGAGVEEERFRRVSREDFRRDPDSDSRLSSRSCLSSRHRAA
jgi:hypothetical protein